MGTSYSEMVRKEMGSDQYQTHIGDKAAECQVLIRRDAFDRGLQNGTLYASIAVSVWVTVNVIKNNMGWMQVGVIEGTTGATFLGIYALCELDRRKYYAQIQQIMDEIRAAIPEQYRLFTNDVIQEEGLHEDCLPQSPEKRQEIKTIKEAIVSTLAKVSPFLASIFA